MWSCALQRPRYLTVHRHFFATTCAATHPVGPSSSLQWYKGAWINSRRAVYILQLVHAPQNTSQFASKQPFSLTDACTGKAKGPPAKLNLTIAQEIVMVEAPITFKNLLLPVK